ncbi:hypothetical protein TKK_0004397 [Trichogramma kaykai]|uniref:Insulin-like domain-containing protein n=1 Tax=Trichogramma kaykai TaxID=54128 RepID=A0ABD2XMJ6_9HYME
MATIRMTLVLLALMMLIGSALLPAPSGVEAFSLHRRLPRRSVRLCSRSLSDALYLLCKDRGYNEPFSSSDEEEIRHATGPGLVEECCYNACSIQQMEQYCKPRKDKKDGEQQQAGGAQSKR